MSHSVLDAAHPVNTAHNGGMSEAPAPAIAIIGAGPRGASIIERIGANLGSLPQRESPDELVIHVVDDAPSGAGRIWRPDQDRELCMNTLAHAVTLFTEPSSTVEGPVRQGPTLHEWCVLALHAEFPSAASAATVSQIPKPHRALFAEFPARPGLAAEYREELAHQVPESHPSRALYGEYLAWFYEYAVACLPAGTQVVRHADRAAGISHEHGREQVELAGGGQILADTVVLATGWMPRKKTPFERSLSTALEQRPELTWVPPASPADQDLSGIAPREPAIVRGLGMGFFDVMALLTLGRGGRFVPDPGSTHGMRYEPSGREPILHVTSRRGVPFRAKTLYRELPPAPAQRHLRAVDWAVKPRPINFNRELWPRIVADAYTDYAGTLHRTAPSALTAPIERVQHAITGALAAALEARTDDLDVAATLIGAAVADFVPDPADRFDLLADMHPVYRDFADPAEFQAWVVSRTAEDLRQASLGHDSALKAGLWSISAARGLAGTIGTRGGFDAESRASGFAMLSDVGGMAGSGPPAFRNQQLLALADAGLVRFIGPAAAVRLGDAGFSAESPRVAGSRIVAPALIDAWMHAHDVRESADPLTARLIAEGRARPFRVPSREGDPRLTGSFDTDRDTGLLIGTDGSVDRTVHVAGIPIDEQVHGTIISPMPGTDPPMLRETDRVARSALRIAAAHVISRG